MARYQDERRRLVGESKERTYQRIKRKLEEEEISPGKRLRLSGVQPTHPITLAAHQAPQGGQDSSSMVSHEGSTYKSPESFTMVFHQVHQALHLLPSVVSHRALMVAPQPSSMVCHRALMVAPQPSSMVSHRALMVAPQPS